MKNILIIGGSGQVGSDVISKYPEIFFSPSSIDLDILEKKSIKEFLDKKNIDLIINFAAFTKVDEAEEKKKIAKELNYKGALNLANAASLKEIGVIHFSTDYVFGDNNEGINLPNDKVSPINYYGFTKSLGEKAILDNCALGFIVRLASVYGRFGDNFIKTIMKLILTSEEVRVVSDQKISMTSSEDLSNNILFLIDLYKEKFLNKPSDNRIIHFTNKGYTNWYKVANVVKSEMETILNKKIPSKLIPICSSNWSSSALRPNDSRLKVNFKELEKSNIFLPRWDTSVRNFVKQTLPAILSELSYE